MRLVLRSMRTNSVPSTAKGDEETEEQLHVHSSCNAGSLETAEFIVLLRTYFIVDSIIGRVPAQTRRYWDVWQSTDVWVLSIHGRRNRGMAITAAMKPTVMRPDSSYALVVKERWVTQLASRAHTTGRVPLMKWLRARFPRGNRFQPLKTNVFLGLRMRTGRRWDGPTPDPKRRPSREEVTDYLSHGTSCQRTDYLFLSQLCDVLCWVNTRFSC
jgi:hypothetical protein